MAAGDALDGALHDEGEQSQANEQHRQGQEYVGKRHDRKAAAKRWAMR